MNTQEVENLYIFVTESKILCFPITCKISFKIAMNLWFLNVYDVYNTLLYSPGFKAHSFSIKAHSDQD